MPKYWVKNYLAHGNFPEVGQKQKTEKEKRNSDTTRLWKVPDVVRNFCNQFGAYAVCCLFGSERYQSSHLPSQNL